MYTVDQRRLDCLSKQVQLVGGSTFVQNSAATGGAVFVSTNVRFLMYQCFLNANQLTMMGGTSGGATAVRR